MIRKLAIIAAYYYHQYFDSSNILKVNDFLKTKIFGKNRLFYVLPFFKVNLRELT